MQERLGRDDLIRWFERGCKPRSEHRIGVEWEKEIVDARGRRLGFDEPGGVEDTLEALAQRFGWTREHEGEHLVGLTRAGEAITLEPGGQLEYSTAPVADLAGVERGLLGHLDELRAVLGDRPVHALSTAYTPLQPLEDIAFLPKARYDVMRAYLKRTGPLAHGMMKGTTSLQVALDFASEADCGRKLRLGMAVAPLALALSANSPLVAGRETGDLSHRGRCWRATDPARTGLLGPVLEGGFSFARYVDWIVQVPMMFVYVDGRYVPGRGRTFASWMTDGFEGTWPDVGAWVTHLTSVFPEARIKNFVELRSMDNAPMPDLLGLAALWTGLFYDDAALSAAEALAGDLPRDRDALLEGAVRSGLGAVAGGRTLGAWAGDLVAIAAGGLDDSAALDPLRARAEADRSPALDTLELWRADPAGFLDAIAY